MNEIITINYNNEQPTVLGRDLHKALEVNTRYNDWFKRMCEYGFDENKDFYSILSKTDNGRPSTDHQLTIAMAKELCMLQRSEKGKEFRKYFIAVEEQWNTPEAVMARALQFANRQLEAVKVQNIQLAETVEQQTKQIIEMKPKVDYYEIILNSPELLTVSEVSKEYGMSAKTFNQLLKDMKIQYKRSKKGIWLLYQKYANEGYTELATSIDTQGKARTITKWTQKGRKFLYDFFKSQGIVPVIEREQSKIA